MCRIRCNGIFRLDCNSRSVVVVGNTVHWLEKQGSCEDSQVRISINKLYSSTLELGGLVMNSSSDLINYLTEINHGKKNN